MGFKTLCFGVLLSTSTAVLVNGQAEAALLYFNGFQSNADLASAQANLHGQIVASPVGTGNALAFTSTQSGYDYISPYIGGTSTGTYTIKFDYLSTASGPGGEFIGIFPGGSISTSPGTSDGWLATDNIGSYPAPFSFASSGTWTPVSLTFDVLTNTNGEFAVKIEQFTGTPGTTYLRNLSVSTGVPEPSTWAMMLLGFAGLSFAGYRSSRKGAAVTV